MRSPSLRADTAKLEAVDLAALALGAPPADTAKLDAVDLAALTLDAPSEGPARNIFAFGTSATWGTTGDNDSDDWAVLGSAAQETKEPTVAPASFLSLSSSNTWGTSGLPGLGGEGAD